MLGLVVPIVAVPRVPDGLPKWVYLVTAIGMALMLIWILVMAVIERNRK